MNLLIVHRSFPGQFATLLEALGRIGGHRMVFVTEAAGRAGSAAGVHVVGYRTVPGSRWTHRDAAEFDGAMRRAAAVAEVAAGLRAGGFVPDLVLGHEGFGEMLNLRDVWPGVPMVALREYFYHMSGADVGWDDEFPVDARALAAVRAKNAVGLLGLAGGWPGVSPTAWQRGLYPGWAQPSIRVVADPVPAALLADCGSLRGQGGRFAGVDLGAGEALVTFVARDLEPYRGFHTLMRALPAVLERPGVRVVCLGGDGVSYGVAPPHGTWRARLLAEMGGALDAGRVHFPGRVPFDEHVRLLRRSDVHVYASYPFVVSWSLREAMACGCAIVAADTAPVREFIEDGQTGVLVPGLDAGALARGVDALLGDEARRTALGEGAARFARRTMQPAAHFEGWRAAVLAAGGPDWGCWPGERA